MDGISGQEGSCSYTVTCQSGDNRDVVDMDVTVEICQVVPDVSYSRAVVAMVGLDTERMGEETVDCDGECAEWDIRNEFETVEGMPVYYGGDLYDSDDSDWEDPRDLAYAEHVVGITLMLRKEWNCSFLSH